MPLRFLTCFSATCSQEVMRRHSVAVGDAIVVHLAYWPQRHVRAHNGALHLTSSSFPLKKQIPENSGKSFLRSTSLAVCRRAASRTRRTFSTGTSISRRRWRRQSTTRSPAIDEFERFS